ncbi:TPA: hypothetical protein DIU27_02720 [Candidatus Collierbacteria bacterium]|uniref:Alkaline phosphatase n=1 Tax=Candidatus Collierbacteria bacterium GW2011_GWB2_44_22 TaxID=1618387 RepID=A0A0G1HXE3_9BACT|nr:MAG: Alkaline phosphatase [Candidatus Collierbacteria bacterium GW2011_GWA2_44_13]KKT48371.1 MAG: Alkaline phosphatase [Candidatus Collierbacteria bacterium GW2011_GWB1_44_197]KKT51796.1 MAG: Alkaline phosphatase [Candidatus Collierbacteria bacterium GW2011_GWB2_44_22]KKT61922.1 MAG: Alkaline phosphatase [Candidatus Collierbacteria bacterium GW2011_GWD1_44_27]KKT65790.1 MAG: Alkaline phosphatase [Candidatus Collierbacteria bacterium GW2011_GWC2_44_30]KKT68460.1 MAG: Alkaline phosphatase [Mi
MKKYFNLTLICLILALAYGIFINGKPQTISSTENAVFATLLPTSESFKIAVVGDFGDPQPSPAKNVADLIRVLEVDAIVTTGDNNYPNGSIDGFVSNTYPYYGQFIDSQAFFPTLGNHDWGYPDENSYSAETLPSSQYFNYLPGNRRYYTTTFGNGLVQIFVLDTDRREPDGNTFDSAQGQWFQNEIIHSPAVYKLVFTHEPFFSSCGKKNSSVTPWPFKDLGITAVFSGHCHLYERLNVNGLTYIVNGAGGGGQIDQFTTITTESIIQYNEQRGAILIEANQTSIKISFVTVSGLFVDQFYIDAGAQQAHP